MSESKHIYIVYKTTNLVNGKFYIGVHKQDFFFPILFDNYLGSGKLLKRAIKKYGTESFIRETLFVYYTQKEAYTKEKELVNEAFVNRKDTYNMILGGIGCRIINHTEETKRKLSKIHKGKKKPRTKEHQEKLSSCHRGSKRSNETKEKLRQVHLGVKHEVVKCPHCNKEGGKSAMTRNHFDNCLLKPNQDIDTIKRNRRHKPHKKHKQTEIVVCPVCGKKGGISAMKRWHFDNCKEPKHHLSFTT